MEEFLKYTLFSINKQEVSVATVLILLAFLISAFIFTRIVKNIFYRIPRFDNAKKYSIFTLFSYFFYLICIAIALQIIGINITLLLAGSAALLVVLGLGIQNLFSDYISGIVILFDNSIKVGDVIEVEQLVCRVQEIKLRTSLVRTRDDKYIIIPNTILTKNPIINWTHNNVAARFEITVGVSYASDMSLVKSLLIESVTENINVLPDPKPFTRCDNFGDSSVQFSLIFWIQDVFRAESIKGGIREVIHEKFRQNGVEIPFPQRVLHHM